LSRQFECAWVLNLEQEEEILICFSVFSAEGDLSSLNLAIVLILELLLFVILDAFYLVLYFNQLGLDTCY